MISILLDSAAPLSFLSEPDPAKSLALTVSASPDTEVDKVYSHKGIATRSFSKNWQLGEDVEVESVTYKDGLLTVVLEKFVPEEKKKKIWFSEKKKSLKGSK